MFQVSPPDAFHELLRAIVAGKRSIPTLDALNCPWIETAHVQYALKYLVVNIIGDANETAVSGRRKDLYESWKPDMERLRRGEGEAQDAHTSRVFLIKALHDAREIHNDGY